MRLGTMVLAGFVAMLAAAPARAQGNPFLGTWNLSGDPPRENFVYWLEVKDEGGKLSAMFLNRGGSPVPAEEVKLADNELTFTLRSGRGGRGPQIALRAEGDKLTGTVTAGNTSVPVTGVRPPKWGECNANAPHTFGKPVALFDGKSLDAWDVQHKDRPSGWSDSEGHAQFGESREISSGRSACQGLDGSGRTDCAGTVAAIERAAPTVSGGEKHGSR